ncbi:uncharacterized protein LOC132720563 [Ruditapes philippinarum]|jgi:hypothetical protein|uniref:uncharacterized protein LOC132720563 n=1 Tax=Ruditapes philippinarum TaxID=129788 RepID=UPI00295ACF7A|nr:uncharacterized protein LOC132720563 [Ruditapes philippinarum]
MDDLQSTSRDFPKQSWSHDHFIRENGSLQRNTTFSLDNYTLHHAQYSDSMKFLVDFIYVLDEFGVPTLLTVGVIFNLILSITIRNSELKKVAACCYFFSIGIVDTLYLIAMAIPWVSIRVVDIYNTEGFCQIVYYLNLLTTFLSSWFIVMLLIERLCFCYRPDTAEKYLNAFRTKCYITVISVFSVVGHLYHTWTSGVYDIQGTNICMLIYEHTKDIMIMRKIDTILAFILPVALCLFFILPLLTFLCASNMKCNDGTLTVKTRMVTLEVKLNSKKMAKYTECPSCSSAANYDKLLRKRLRMVSQSKRLTLVSVIVALVYAFLFIPHSVIKSRVTFLNGDYHVTFEDALFLKLFEELFKINFAYKALVYFTLLPEMRKNLIKAFIPSCKKKKTFEYEQKSLETQL